MGGIPLLNRDGEVQSARQIELWRRRYRHELLGNDYALRSAVKLLERVEAGTVRLDRTLEVSVTNTDEKKRLLKVSEINQNREDENKIEVLDNAGIDNAINQTLAGINAAIIDAQREQTKIETWRNRNWKTGDLTIPAGPFEPDETKPGLYQVKGNFTLKLYVADKDNEKPLNEGAELAIFNLKADDEYGFLGVFIVEEVKDQGAKILSLTISPLVTPDARDIAAWDDWENAKYKTNDPKVAVYEDLPTTSGVSVDALTALFGTEVETANNGSITSGGIEGMRRDLFEELSAIDVMIDSISLAKAATERERDRKKQTASDLEKDRDAWVEDQQFAQAALERLNVRNSRLQKTIRDTRASIFDLRKELAELNGRLMAEGNRKQQAGEKSAADSGATALR